jgi:hypothetical protein|tara:strand:+ start:2959 stop:3195 length:237 start_codon:yes stop_codon:yes gene_type:complete
MTSIKFSIRDVDFIEWLSDKKTGISTLGIDNLLKYYMKENTPVIMEDQFRPRFPENSEMIWWYDPIEKVTYYQQTIKD